MRTLIHAMLVMVGLLATKVQAQPANFNVDERHTFVTFVYTHLGLTNIRGRMNTQKGATIQMDPQAKTGRVEITIDVPTVSTGFGVLDKHLASPEVFNTPVYPTAKFVGDKFSFEGSRVTAVAGTLTLMGKDYPITLKSTQYHCTVNPVNQRTICGAEFETQIDREAMGITFGLSGAHKSRDVKLVVAVEAFQQ